MVQCKNPMSYSYLRIFLVASLYWFVSITLVFVNKSLLSGHEDLDAPFFVTWLITLLLLLLQLSLKLSSTIVYVPQVFCATVLAIVPFVVDVPTVVVAAVAAAAAAVPHAATSV